MSLKIGEYISWISPFKKKKEPPVFPNKFALIRYSPHAKEIGMYNEENKIIEIYRGSKLIESLQFTEELVKALEEEDEVPVVSELFEEEPFTFEEVASFGKTEFRR